MKKKIAFKTLGCRLNQFETDALVTDFDKASYQIVDFSEPADVYVVNTCTVTNTSDQKSKNMISQAVRRTEDPIVVVTGCLANSQKEMLEKRDGITYIVDNTRKSSIFSLVDSHFKGELLRPEDLEQDIFNFSVADRGFHTRSMIKIQDGCDNFCTYCIVPKVRGRAISRPVSEILENIKSVLDAGYKEIVLTGVNISRYGYSGLNFEDLVEKIIELPGDFRVRISSIEPEGFGDKFTRLFEHPKLCRHLHLCLQSGSDKILMSMRRMYNVDTFRKIAGHFKNKYPDFNFTTDVIVGFPDESEKDFKETCKVTEEIGFSHIHTFKYSVRKGTRAERMTGQIPEKIKSERSRIIRSIAEENKFKYRSRLTGKNQKVLIERISDKGLASGYGELYVPVEFQAGSAAKNTFQEVNLQKVIKSKDNIIKGVVI